MFCLTAAGDILPPYVVHRAANKYDTWREGGPKDTSSCEKNCYIRDAL